MKANLISKAKVVKEFNDQNNSLKATHLVSVLEAQTKSFP